MLMNIPLSPDVLRVLGVGIDHLQNGDLKDRTVSSAVAVLLRNLGYVVNSNAIVTRNRVLVVSHFHPEGADRDVFTDEERAQLITQLGSIDPELLKLEKMPDIVEEALAEVIRTARKIKGLRYEPLGLA